MSLGLQKQVGIPFIVPATHSVKTYFWINQPIPEPWSNLTVAVSPEGIGNLAPGFYK